MDAHVVENFLLVIHERRAHRAVAHDIRRRVQHCGIGRSHDQTNVVRLAQHSLPVVNFVQRA